MIFTASAQSPTSVSVEWDIRDRTLGGVLLSLTIEQTQWIPGIPGGGAGLPPDANLGSPSGPTVTQSSLSGNGSMLFGNLQPYTLYNYLLTLCGTNILMIQCHLHTARSRSLWRQQHQQTWRTLQIHH